MKTIDVIGLPSHQRFSGSLTSVVDALSKSDLRITEMQEGEFLLKDGARPDSHGHAVLVEVFLRQEGRRFLKPQGNVTLTLSFI